MIKLTKQPEPRVLMENGTKWTSDLVEKIAAGQKPTDAEKSRYRHKEIKAALEIETAGKCAYCESKLKHIHHGDVEHIYPKSLDPLRQFKWENLTLACEICNQNKSNTDPNFQNIIDPYVLDPSDHIYFVGAIALGRGVSGVSTTSLLKLNRAALLEMRGETLKKVVGVFETVLGGNLPVLVRRVILNDLELNDAGLGSQYSSMVQAAIQNLRLIEPEL